LNDRAEIADVPLQMTDSHGLEIRNFCIIAHIDHGKSTLADRLLLRTGAIADRDFREQLLDSMDLERERGITIKASAVTLQHEHAGRSYMLNLIDTPGHVDFHYEVAKALQACEGALLLVDAAQGVQAQTVANAYQAVEAGLEIIPVINKIDLPTARPEDAAMEIEHAIGLAADDCVFVSARSGEGVEELLEAIVHRIPPPRSSGARQTRGLIFDSIYDDYRGVVCYVRMIDGVIRKGDRISMMGKQRAYQVSDLAKTTPFVKSVDRIAAGEVGMLFANIKTLRDVAIGDTITQAADPSPDPLPGYRPPMWLVFCDFFAGQGTEYSVLREALDRLQLNDTSFSYAPITSDAMGFGFRCGFQGLLHMEVIQERLEREADVTVVQTAPTVSYEILQRDGATIRIDSPSELPDLSVVEEIREPIVTASLVIPSDSLGGVLKLAEERRGNQKTTEYLSPTRVIVVYELPLAEILYDFYDKLKSVTRGYGTLDYDVMGYRADDLVRMDILVGGTAVDALSTIVHRSLADVRGRKVIRKLKEEIDRHQFEIPLQVAIGNRVIARETIKAFRKNVTAKCYGGDVTRKRKLLEKQKEGKKRMRQVGQVEIPQEAFMAVMKLDE
jgi:GTP-binding protein LepA